MQDILDRTDVVATTFIRALHGHEVAEAELVELYPEAKDFISELVKNAKGFHPLVFVYNGDTEPDWVLISEDCNHINFLQNVISILSVMEATEVVLIADTYISTSGSDESLEERFTMKDPDVTEALVLNIFNTTGNAQTRLIPYVNKGGGEIDFSVPRDIINKGGEDPTFDIVLEGVTSILSESVEDRVANFWREYISDEVASAIFFENTDITRQQALEALDKLVEENEVLYAQRIIEDSSMAASSLRALKRSDASLLLDEDIGNHMTNETEIAKWLIQTRLMP